VSLPEVPLLGVLPGTGGLTRITDKRKVRHDLADIFCTTTEGVRGQRAKDWRLVDDIVKPAQFAEKIQERAFALAASSDRPADAKGVALTPLHRTIEADKLSYRYVTADIDRQRRIASLTVHAPDVAEPQSLDGILAAGANWWPLQMARELDDAILNLRTGEADIGTWLLHTRGDPQVVLDCDRAMETHKDNWFVRETLGLLRRTLARLDVSSRTLFALIDKNSCFAGSLLELALAADRSYMLDVGNEAGNAPRLTLSSLNFGSLPMVNGKTRLERRFYCDAASMTAVRAVIGEALSAPRASQLGLVTVTPDDIDWDNEIRLATEERASLSPDALTGMEANLRFGVYETMETRVFGRLSAWQNWIFIRPNAVGEKGALKIYGKGDTAAFDWQRV
jgi:benzoyl-CoA-dihydrodiol lyase